MRKSKSKVYRWIAAMLTAALLVGQCQVPVLANEGTAPTETGISDENKAGAQEDGADVKDKDALKDGEDGSDNGDGESGVGNGGKEGGVGSDNGDAGEGGTGETGSDNPGTNDDGENNPGEGGDETGDEDENQGGEEDAQNQCVCETACTEDAVNVDCPVCVADYAVCAKNAGGEAEASVKMVSGNELEEVESKPQRAYSVGDIYIDEQGIQYILLNGNKAEVMGHKGAGEVSGEVIIPDVVDIDNVKYTVSGIGTKAFYHYSEVSSIKLPMNLESIGDEAFSNCRALNNVVIPNGVRSIGKKAFVGCSVLTSIEIPGSVNSISEDTFSNCTRLTEVIIPDSVRNIGEGAFYGCSSLVSITIPSSVASIGKKAFYGCKNLTSIQIPDSVTVLSDHVFCNCTGLRNVIIPDNIISIGQYAFHGCWALTDIEIPNKVTAIGKEAFSWCIGLTSVTLPDSVTSLGAGAFCECTALRSIELSKNITNMADRVLFGCESLISVEIPDGVTYIGASAFLGCENLANVKMPCSVEMIGDRAFLGCYSLRTLQIITPASGDVTPPYVVSNYSFSIVRNRFVVFETKDGTRLTGSALRKAQTSYREDDRDKNAQDNLWWGWELVSIRINARKDDNDWGGHHKKFGLKPIKNMDAELVTDFWVVEDGQYLIYDITGDASLTTGVDITVHDGLAEAVVDYYTITCYDGDVEYAYDTPQAAQIILNGQKGVKPEEPSKPNHTFIGWVTTNGGDDFYDFSAKVKNKTDIYAKWEADESQLAFPVTVKVQKDDAIWSVHNRTFALTKDNATTTTFTTDLDAVEPGTYEIYDVTGVSAVDEYGAKGVNTGVTVTVVDADVSATVDYYTATFYDFDAGRNEVKYGESTDQKPQTILKKVGRVTMPVTDPEKAGHTFEKWVTTPDGDEEFNFASAEVTAPTKIYAKWKVNPAPTYTVTINVKKDGKPWSGHGRTFALLGGGGSGFLEVPGQGGDSTYSLSQVPDGTYRIYDVTGIPADSLYSRARDTGTEVRVKGADTEVDVTINGADVEKDIHYYTATFYDGTEAYKAGTPQEPQTIIRGKKVAKPEDPQKADWQFAGWKTTDGGTTAYDFDAAVNDTTRIFASWVVKTAQQFHITAAAAEGGTISPTGDIVVTKGGEQTFTITPNEGKKIKAVTVDGSDVTDKLADTLARAQMGARYYTFTNVTGDHTIHAEFADDGGDTPDPGPDPGPNPDPGPDPGPNPDPGPTPDPNPGPGPTPDPGPDPTPGSDPTPGPGPNPDPGSGGDSPQESAGSTVAKPQAINTVTDSTVAAAQKKEPQAGNGKEPKTGDSTPVEVYATVAMIAGLTYLLLYFMEEGRGMTEREKEVFVAAFIRWAKKGGRFRRCCAIAAIFCLLTYYHAIGKYAHRNSLGREYLRQAL